MRGKRLILAAIFTLLAPFAVAGGGKWFNVHVTEHDDGAEVQIHVPMSLVSVALEALETGHLYHGRVRICAHDDDLDWPDIMRELRTIPRGQEVSRRDHDGDIRLRRTDDQVEISVTPREPGEERIELRVSAPLLELLTRDRSEEFDFGQLERALAEATGELLTIASDDADVRIWVE